MFSFGSPVSEDRIRDCILQMFIAMDITFSTKETGRVMPEESNEFPFILSKFCNNSAESGKLAFGKHNSFGIFILNCDLWFFAKLPSFQNKGTHSWES